MILEFITCKKCKIQQPRENFKYCGGVNNTCKFCNKKTNIIPNKYKNTTEDALNYLNKILFDVKSETSIFFQTQMLPVLDFLERQRCKEVEDKLK